MPSLFSGSYAALLATVLSVPGIIFAFSWKSFSQAWVSKKLGDPTPEAQGRLTLNPLAHMDWFGLICMILFHFGWHKPLPTNSRFYRNVRRDKAIFAASGPCSLIVAGFLLSIFSSLFSVIRVKAPDNTLLTIVELIFSTAAQYAIFLAFFYLLPLPGLDGYNFITAFLPYKANGFLYKVERYSMFIFLGFILLIDFTPLGGLIFWPANALINVFSGLWYTVWSLIIP